MNAMDRLTAIKNTYKSKLEIVNQMLLDSKNGDAKYLDHYLEGLQEAYDGIIRVIIQHQLEIEHEESKRKNNSN